MELTLQLYHGGTWHDAASLTVERPELGINGPTRIAYEPDYFLEHGAIAFAEDKPIRDARALSVNLPVSLEDTPRATWPPFLLDLLPQGFQRKKIADYLKLNPEASSTELPLLMRTGGAPVGNVRIKEAFLEEAERLRGEARTGLTIDDILGRTDRFMDVAERFAVIASGSSGLQGEWPKIALTLGNDGKWYPDPMVDDGDACDHIIVKLLRSNDENDRLILEAEAGYSAVAKEFGLTVKGTTTYRNGVLVISRFDRTVEGGHFVRYGQESLVSAIDVAAFDHLDTHENYLQVLRKYSTEPLLDIAEYVLRDLLNLAMGNPDNHGRNTALRKTELGSIRLAPLYDFAPMRLATAGIARSTKWDCMKAQGRDTAPDWRAVSEAAAGGDFPAQKIRDALLAKEELLRSLPAIGRKHAVPEVVIERAMGRHSEVASAVAELRHNLR
jgi:serine/threonine-protein kinase HipA